MKPGRAESAVTLAVLTKLVRFVTCQTESAVASEGWR